MLYSIKLAKIFGVSRDYLLEVNKRLTVDITALDKSQKQAVLFMIKLFERDNAAIAEKNKAP